MQKTLTLLLLFISFIALNSSCKKDEAKKNKELLISGKWYYDYITNHRAGGTVNNCFNEAHYIEFKTDGKIDMVTFDRGREDHTLVNGTYTLSEDGKNLSIITDRSWTGTIHLIKDNYLRITLAPDNFYSYELVLAHKKANPNCQPAK